MTNILAGPGFGGGQAPSRETVALKDIDASKHTFVNRDFVRNMAWLNQSVTTLSSYSQLLQKGVDQANQNPIEQIQGFIADLMVMFAGFEPTGVWTFGDLKYVIQGIGALLGVNPETPFPLNLAEAAWHLFNTYIVPLPQFTDLIFDAVIAWAEVLGLSDEAVDAIQEFDNSVVALYNGIGDSFGNMGTAVKRMLTTFGLAGGWFDMGPLNDLWNEVKDLIQDIVSGPQDLLLNILSKIVVVTFKSMTWVTNLMNPQNWLAAMGLNFLGPQILPEISGSTSDWSVTANPATGWVFDDTTQYEDVGSFKTDGNGSNKRILTQTKYTCAPGETYGLTGQLKWSGIPTGEDTFGPCIVFYTGSTEVSQINVNASAGHGATGGWEQVVQSVAVPNDVDGFRVGARVNPAINTGTVWVAQLSCSKSQSWDEALSSLLQSFLPFRIWQTLLDAFKGGVNGVIGDVISRIQHLIPGTGLFNGSFISGVLDALNIPFLDASRINSGAFTDAFLPGLGTLRDKIAEALGGVGSGFTAAQVKTFLQNIPGGNIVSAILASIIPPLDASIIGSGTFAQSLITNLVTDLASLLPRNLFGAQSRRGSNLIADPALDDSSFNTARYNRRGRGVAGYDNWSHDTSVKHSGSQSLKYIHPGGTLYPAIYFTPEMAEDTFSATDLTKYIPVRPGQKFWVSFWAYAAPGNTGTNQVKGYIFCRNTPDSVGAAVEACTANLSPGVWTQVSGYATVPASRDRMLPHLCSLRPGANAGDIVYFDDVECYEVTESQNIIAQIFGGTSILSKIVATVVPNLDATIINSGQFAQSFVTNLVTDLGNRLLTTIFDARATAATNQVIDPSFEDTTIYRKEYMCTWAYSNEQKHSGSNSIKMTVRSSGTVADFIYMLPHQSAFNATDPRSGVSGIKVVEGEKYYMEAWIYPHASNAHTGGQPRLNMVWGDGVAADTTTSLAHINDDGTMPAGWQKLSAYFTVPAGKRYMWPRIYVGGVANSNVYYWDDVIVREVTEPQNIIQGLFGGTGILSKILSTVVPNLDATIINSGTFAQSMVTNLVTDLGNRLLTNVFNRFTESGTNLVLSPNFEDTAIVRIPYTTTGFTHGYSTEQLRVGFRSYKWTTTGLNWAGMELAPNETQKYHSVKEGEIYKASVWLKPHASNNATVGYVKLFMRFRNSSDATTTDFSHTINNSALTNTWQEFSRVATCPAGKDQLELMILSDPTTTVGNAYYIDTVTLRETTEPHSIIAQIFGGTSVLSQILTTVVPNLDASIINSGTFAMSIISGLLNGAGKFVRDLIGVQDYENLAAGSTGDWINHAWTLGTGWSIATDQKNTGTSSLKCVGAGGSSVTATPIPTSFQVSPGDKIYAEFWVRIDSSFAAADAKLRFAYPNGGGTYIQDLPFHSGSYPPANTWTKLTETWTVPAGVTEVGFRFNSNQTAGTMWIDDIVIRRVKAAEHIVDLPGTKIISAVLSAIVPTLDDSKLPGLGALRDAVVQAILGGSSTGYTAANVKTQMEDITDKSLNWVDGFFNALTGQSLSGVATAEAAEQAAAVADATVAAASLAAALRAQQIGGANAGIAGGDDFEMTVSSTAIGGDTRWLRYYNGAGAHVLAVPDGHNAAMVRSGTSRREVNARRTLTADAVTLGDYQLVTMVTGSSVISKPWLFGDSDAYNAITVRESADGNHFVQARITGKSAQFYYSTTGLAGAATIGSSVTTSQGAGVIWQVEAGTAGGLRVFRLYRNGAIILTTTDGSSVTSAGASYRGWGFGMAMEDYSPSNITRVTVADNTPQPTVGSYARIYRTSTSTVSFSTGKWPSSFLTTTDRISSDLTFNGGSNNGVTVSKAGPYVVKLSVNVGSQSYDDGTAKQLLLTLYNGSTIVGKAGHLAGTGMVTSKSGATISSLVLIVTPSSQILQAVFCVYCNAGDILYPGCNFSSSNSCKGSADGLEAFMEIVGGGDKLPAIALT